mmetsp:Transcript_19227/g.30151  ORF Transcript_19227/g.30151 Transcript_19227/m.30151 type:complete len:205 (+) Transcript_19227:158-772(+)
MEGERNTNDEEYHEAFGEHTNISENCRYKINLIRDNDPNVKWFKNFYMDRNDVEHFSDLAWELLGRYIAENDHLEELVLDHLQLTDEKMTLLFKHLNRSTSLKKLNLTGNNIGLDGIQSMIPFLKNSPNLKILKIWRNDNINADFLSLLISGLLIIDFPFLFVKPSKAVAVMFRLRFHFCVLFLRRLKAFGQFAANPRQNASLS